MIRADHVGMPARDKDAAAAWLADLFASRVTAAGGPFVAVRVGSFTVDFFDADQVEAMHLAFVADPSDFDALLHRLRAARIGYGSQPDDPANGRTDHPLVERGLYVRTPDGHLLEVMAEPTSASPAMTTPSLAGRPRHMRVPERCCASERRPGPCSRRAS